MLETVSVWYSPLFKMHQLTNSNTVCCVIVSSIVTSKLSKLNTAYDFLRYCIKNDDEYKDRENTHTKCVNDTVL